MDRALVVFESDDQGRELLAQAGELAAGVDAHLDVLTLLSAEEFAERQDSLDAAAAGEQTSWDDRAVLDAAHQDVEEAASEVLADLELEWDALAGRVGEAESQADRILATADENDADHVFLTGQRRSPTGKAVFGDRTQAVILNFDGPVTTLMD